MTTLRGLEAIGNYLGITANTARRYIVDRNLPAMQLKRQCGAPYWITTPRLIDIWILSNDRARRRKEAEAG